MTKNLTESMASFPWTTWLVLAALAFAVELFRRDRWAETLVMGCILAAAISVALPRTPAFHFAGLVVGTLASALLSRPWHPESTDADVADH